MVTLSMGRDMMVELQHFDKVRSGMEHSRRDKVETVDFETTLHVTSFLVDQ